MSKKTRETQSGKPLNRTERAVLANAAAGLDAKEIGKEVSLSDRTVEGARRSAAAKLGTKGIAETIATAVSEGEIAVAYLDANGNEI